jgi:peptidoglycan/xylan/chitin deacetylase (PgdA/CDA1 family)
MRTYLIRVAKRIARRIVGRPILGKSILVYHRVAKQHFDPWNLAVTPEEFERQLVILRRKTVLPLREFVSLHTQNNLPRNAVAITFDDGYACNALVAAPMLDSYSYPATFFVVSDAIARPEEFWWDQLEFIFRAPGFDYEAATRLLANYTVNGLRAAVRRDRPPLAAFLQLWERLRIVSSQERRRYLDDLRAQVGLKKEMRPTHRPMTSAELRELAANPLFEIGGHTVTHPSLPALPRAEQEQEITLGSRFLEAMLAKPIHSISYPFGDWTEDTRDIVKSAGFECACATAHRTVRSHDSPFALPRRQVVNRNARPLEDQLKDIGED